GTALEAEAAVPAADQRRRDPQPTAALAPHDDFGAAQADLAGFRGPLDDHELHFHWLCTRSMASRSGGFTPLSPQGRGECVWPPFSIAGAAALATSFLAQPARKKKAARGSFPRAAQERGEPGVTEARRPGSTGS